MWAVDSMPEGDGETRPRPRFNGCAGVRGESERRLRGERRRSPRKSRQFRELPGPRAQRKQHPGPERVNPQIAPSIIPPYKRVPRSEAISAAAAACTENQSTTGQESNGARRGTRVDL